MPRKEQVLELKNLYVERHGQRLLRDLNVRLYRGELLAVLGDGASGKTRLLHLMAGLEKPSGGVLSLFGEAPEHMKRCRRIGLVLQKEVFMPQCTALQNLQYYSLQRGLHDRKVIYAACERTGFEALDSLYVNLSPGQRQRLALARVLLEDLDLLLIDEPFSCMGEEEIPSLAELLNNLAHRDKKAVLFTSSSFPSHLNFCDRYCFMADGQIVHEIEAEELRRRSGLCLRLQVDRPEACLNFLEQHYDWQDLEVDADYSLRIYSQRYESWELNRLLVLEGFQVKSLTAEAEHLRDYYERMIRGKGGHEL